MRREKTKESRRKPAFKRENPRDKKRENYRRERVDRAKGNRDEAPDNDNIVGGRNPVMELIKSGRPIEKIIVAKGAEGSIKKIVAMAGEKGILTKQIDRETLNKIGRDINHQGIIAVAAAHEYSSMDDIFKKAKTQGEDPFVLILDGIEDPHNLGAIMRTAECAGAHGVIIPKRRSAGLTEVVAKASAGAIEYMPCVRVPNLVGAIEELKEKGLWIGACDMDGELYYKRDMKGAVGVVIGNEGSGVSRLVKENCDFVVSMPIMGKVNSLNASNAAAVVAYEIRRQRQE